MTELIYPAVENIGTVVQDLRVRVEALELGGLEQAESQRFCVDAIVRRLEKLEADAAMTGKLQARPDD